MSIEINLTTTRDRDEWSRYVDSHPRSTIYHTLDWRNVIEKTFGHRTFYIYALGAGDRMCGILPLALVKGFPPKKRFVSLPFSYTCGPASDSPDVITKMVEKAKILCREMGCTYLEIRTTRMPIGRFIKDNTFSTYILQLSRDADTVWRRLSKSSVRSAINKAKRNGVSVHRATSRNDLLKFHQLNQLTKKRLGVPSHPIEFLRNVFKELNGLANLYLAEYKDRAIAGAVCLHFKDRVIFGYGASDLEYSSLRANNLLIWEIIKEACEKGYRYFDFGRTSRFDTGSKAFKGRWGTREVPLHYWYYPKMPKVAWNNRNDVLYRMFTGLCRRLPLRLTEGIGGILYNYVD